MSDKQLDTIIGKMDEIKETLELAGQPRLGIDAQYDRSLQRLRGYVGDPTPGPVVPLSFLLRQMHYGTQDYPHQTIGQAILDWLQLDYSFGQHSTRSGAACTSFTSGGWSTKTHARPGGVP